MRQIRLMIAFCVIVVSACFIPAFARSEDRNRCVAAAPLWLPSETTREKVVTKWRNNVIFSIVSNENASATVGLIKDRLKFVSQQTALRIYSRDATDNPPLPDLMIVVAPNIVGNASSLRGLALSYLRGKLGDRGRFEIDARAWDAGISRISPKCTNLDMEANGEKHLSFVIVQENETAACIDIGLSLAFGAVGARQYYLANHNSISEEVLAAAFQGLYSKQIVAGMSAAEAAGHLNEACKR